MYYVYALQSIDRPKSGILDGDSIRIAYMHVSMYGMVKLNLDWTFGGCT
jgi:hypothetical protein